MRPKYESHTTIVSPDRTSRCSGSENSPGPRPSRPIDVEKIPEGSKSKTLFSAADRRATLPSESGATLMILHTRWDESAETSFGLTGPPITKSGSEFTVQKLPGPHSGVWFSTIMTPAESRSTNPSTWLGTGSGPQELAAKTDRRLKWTVRLPLLATSLTRPGSGAGLSRGTPSNTYGTDSNADATLRGFCSSAANSGRVCGSTGMVAKALTRSQGRMTSIRQY